MANQLFKLIHGLYQANLIYGNISPMVWSEPGQGKTANFKTLGEVLNHLVITKTGNKSDPTDFSGVPYLVDVKTKSGETKKKMKYSEPTYVSELKRDNKGILFFDELTTCPPSIQTPMLSIIQDGDFGEFKIPHSIFRCAAGNYTNVVGCHQMSIALLNRMIHIHHSMDVETFCGGFASGWSNYEQATINPQSDIKKKEFQYRVMVTDFIKANPDYLTRIPETIADPTDVAYPTPRSWEMLCEILAVLDGNDKEYIDELIDGTIGVDAARLFKKFMKSTKKFDIDLSKYLGKESKFEFPNPEKHDEVTHIVDSIMFYSKDEPEKYLKLWVRIINLLHNKDDRFGKYAGYDGLIMKFIGAAMANFDKADILNRDIILGFHGQGDKALTIDDFDDLYILGANLNL